MCRIIEALSKAGSWRGLEIFATEAFFIDALPGIG